MTILQRMLMRAFLPVLAVAALFFVLVIELADVFPNLFRYLSNEVPLSVIGQIALLYLPKALLFALPIALLFSAAYTLGYLYSRNELVAIFGSGISLRALVMPLLGLGLILSVAVFLFEDRVVIPTFQHKNQLYRTAVNIRISLSDSNVAVTSADGSVIYHADFYNDEKQLLTGVLVVRRGDGGTVKMRLDATEAQWDGQQWIFQNVRRFLWDGGVMAETAHARFSDAALAEPPDTFRRVSRDVNEMSYSDAVAWVEALRRAGRAYRESLTETYSKLSFALTPLVVMLIATAVGGLLRRNILLMSLMLALGIAVVFFVLRMIGGILAKSGLLPPLVGAFAGVVVFLCVGLILFRVVRT